MWLHERKPRHALRKEARVRQARRRTFTVEALEGRLVLSNFSIQLSEPGFAPLVLVDSGSTGVITINNVTYGDFKITSMTGLSKPLVGSPPTTAEMHLNDLQLTSTNSGKTLTIQMSDNGFSLNPGTTSVTSTFGGTNSGGAQLTYQAYVDTSNALFGKATPIGPLFSTTATSFNNPPTTASFNQSGPFSMTEVVTIAATGSSQVGFDGDILATAPNTPSTPVGPGQFATIGFWRNKNGQAVINSFNGGSDQILLGNWLATTFPHLFGTSNPYTGTSLAGLTNAQVATVYSNLSNSGVTQNTYIQAFAVALGIYADTTSLGGASLIANGLAAKYGFNVTSAGGGNSTFNITGNEAAFPGLGSNPTVFQILAVVDANFNPATGLFYGGDQTLTSEANNVLNGINTKGDIS
jgi:hypothetical protein